LPSPGMDVDIAYFYNANSAYNGPFGYGRTINTNLTAQASGNPLVVTLTRGNGSVAVYQQASTFASGPYAPQSLGLINPLFRDTTNSYWKETTPDGHLTVYPLDTAGNITSIVYAQDAVGNRHTFSYSSGLLQTLEDAVGRLVTFSYNASSLLQTIQDWAG